MQAINTQRYIRMSPRKLRLVADIVRGVRPAVAVEKLPYVHKRAAEPIRKAIQTAIANAVQQGARAEDLVFKELQIGEGPRLKRGKAVSRGQWHPRVKLMSHIRVVVETAKGSSVAAKASVSKIESSSQNEEVVAEEVVSNTKTKVVAAAKKRKEKVQK